MAQKHIIVKAGVDTQATGLAGSGRWLFSSLIRFRDGWAESIRGWLSYTDTAVSGVCRSLHQWIDLRKGVWLAAGTNTNLYLYGTNGEQFDITPAAEFTPGVATSDFSTDIRLQSWTYDNFGERLIANPTKQGIFLWTPPDTSVAATRIAEAPPQNQGVFVVMPARIILAYGSSLDDGDQDPMLVRWCDQENYLDWTPSTTNQAGSFRLSRGSRIVGGLQSGITTLLWTDSDLWIVQYIGFPLVFSFTQASSQCGLIAQHAVTTFAGSAYWLSESGFFQHSGSGVNKLPCSVWDAVFRDLKVDQKDKCIAGVNSGESEIWFFYASAFDDTTEIDSYAKYNVLEKVWDYGAGLPGIPNDMARTAWKDQYGSITFTGRPLAVDLSGIIQIQESDFTANGVALTNCQISSGFVDISDGDNAVFVDQFIPDFRWSSANDELVVILSFREYPGVVATTMGPFNITPITKFVTLRSSREVTVGRTTITAYPAIRAREVAIYINTVRGWWRMGAPRLRVVIAGREP